MWIGLNLQPYLATLLCRGTQCLFYGFINNKKTNTEDHAGEVFCSLCLISQIRLLLLNFITMYTLTQTKSDFWMCWQTLTRVGLSLMTVMSSRLGTDSQSTVCFCSLCDGSGAQRVSQPAIGHTDKVSVFTISAFFL